MASRFPVRAIAERLPEFGAIRFLKSRGRREETVVQPLSLHFDRLRTGLFLSGSVSINGPERKAAVFDYVSKPDWIASSARWITEQKPIHRTLLTPFVIQISPVLLSS